MDKRIIANELLPVYETANGEREVDGRELHSFLWVGRDFTTWIKDKIRKFGFKDGTDFTVTLTKTGERQNVLQHEYDLTLSMAKELCMVENNEQGSKARKYFIAVEERFKAQSIDVSLLSPEMQMFKQIWDGQARMQLEQVETQKSLQSVQTAVATIKETFLQRDEDWRTSINSMLNAAVARTNGDHREIRSDSYQRLEERAGTRLNVKLTNLKKRLEEGGATKTRVKEASKLEVIEEDKRLKEIYTTIVKELSIGSL
jgi:phage anti-repressor protein